MARKRSGFRRLNRHDRGSAGVVSTAFAPQAGSIAVAGPATQIKIFGGDRHDTLMGTLDGHESKVNMVVYCGEYKLFCSASDDGTVRLWRTTDGQPTSVLRGHTGPVLCLNVSHDGKHLLSGGADGTIKAWDLATFQLIQQWRGHGRPVCSVAATSDGTAPISADGTEFIRRWSWDAPESPFSMTSAADVRAMAASPISPLLATGDNDGMVRLWNIRTGDQRMTLGRHDSPVLDLHFSHDGELLASCSADGVVRVWDPHQGEMLQHFMAHAASVTSVRFAHVSDTLTTSSTDGTFKIWRILNRPDARWIGDGGRDLVDISFSAKGHSLAVLHGHNPSVEATAPPLRDLDDVYHLREAFRSMAFLPDGERPPRRSTTGTYN